MRQAGQPAREFESLQLRFQRASSYDEAFLLSSSVLSLLLSISLIISAISPFSSIEEAFSRLAFLKAKDQDRDSVTFTQHNVHFDLEILDDIEQISENILQLLKKASDIKPSSTTGRNHYCWIYGRDKEHVDNTQPHH